MKTNFLVGWNDECVNMRMIAGPFKSDEKEIQIKQEVIRMLKKIYGYDETMAVKIYNTIASGSSYLAPNGTAINLLIWPNGASLQYEDAYEDRIEVLEYDLDARHIIDWLCTYFGV